MSAVRQSGVSENRSREQYFFDAPTVREWALVARRFENPCVLCAPTVGAELRGARSLDIDERFNVLEGFRRWDLRAPEFLGERFGVVLCDPPFFGVSLGQLARALDVVSGFDCAQPVAVAYLKRRERAVVGALARFGVRPTGARVGYLSVEAQGRNEVEVYANFEWGGC